MGNNTQFEDLIEQSKNIVFFGGAGVSTESGIPDFRGNNGLYTFGSDMGFSPEEILHHNFFVRHTGQFYEYYRSKMLYPDAVPNYAHTVLAKMERAKKLSAVVTQNIDGLHQKAGSQNVIELHGSTLRNYCMKCGRKYGIEHIMTEDVPVCPVCGGIIRPDVVLYGEGLPTDGWARAEEAISSADMLIVGGTSLTVQPAASLISYFNNDNLVIINKTPTPYDGYAKTVIRDPIAEVFKKIDDKGLFDV